MNPTLVFADSEVSSVELSSEGIHIRLSAAHVLRTPEGAGGKAEEGYARGVEVVLLGGRLHNPPSHWFGRVSHGRILHGNQWAASVPLPSSSAEPVELELTLANQSHLAAHGTGIQCRFLIEPNFTESLFC